MGQPGPRTRNDVLESSRDTITCQVHWSYGSRLSLHQAGQYPLEAFPSCLAVTLFRVRSKSTWSQSLSKMRLPSAFSGVDPGRGIRTSVSVSSFACILTPIHHILDPPDGTGSPRSKQHCADQYAAGSTQCRNVAKGVAWACPSGVGSNRLPTEASPFFVCLSLYQGDVSTRTRRGGEGG